MRVRSWHLCTTAMIACLSVAGAARAAVLTEIDIIPTTDSAETQQNSEPSLGVNPNSPSQVVAGSFTGIFNGPPTNVTTPYFQTVTGGTAWSDFGGLQTLDKSIAWSPNGTNNAMTATLNGVQDKPTITQIQTFSGAVPGPGFVGPPVNTFNSTPPGFLDQPWIRTGPSAIGSPNTAAQRNVYVGYNDLTRFGALGNTASVNVSAALGASPTQVVLDAPGVTGAGQDGPSVRVAADQSGNTGTVYAVFTRWNSTVSNTTDGFRLASDEVVVKSTTFGASFAPTLNPVAHPITPFTSADNSLLSLGQERIGSDNAIAVDPKAATHVVVAYTDSPSIGQIQVHVAESTDGGDHWTDKLTTSASTRSATPALTIKADGTIALLYNEYNPRTDKLTQHLVTTANDFATTADTILGTENNSTSGGPAPQFDPYVGDFTDLTSLDNVLYGVFSASNAADGTLATFFNNTGSLFQRDFTGTVGTASFALNDGLGHAVPFSIDPFFFSLNENVVPEPGTLALLGTSLLGLAALRRRRQK